MLKSTLPIRPRRLWMALVFFILATGCFIAGFWPTANVKLTTNRQITTSWVWLDQIMPEGSVNGGRFEGYVRLPASRVFWLENNGAAYLKFQLNGQVVYEGNGSPEIDLDAALPAVVPFALDYQVDNADAFPPDGKIALLQATLGIHYPVPAWRFVQGPVSPDVAGDVARLLAVIFGLAAFILAVSAFHLSRRTWLIFALILLVALAARLVTLHEKFVNDPGLWTMAKVWDNYASMGRGWLAGSTPVGGNIYQQGTFIYLGMVQSAIGPNLATLYIWNTVLGAFAALFLAAAAWMLFGRTTGIVAGLLTALFAPLIHYQQTLQDTSPVTLLLCMMVFSLAVLYRERNLSLTILFALLYGLCGGLAGTLRSSVLVLLALPVVLFVFQGKSWLLRMGLSALVAFTAALCILPITITNFDAGYHVLTANLADYQLFRSNNLDSTGVNTFLTQSEQLAIARRQSWMNALKGEIDRAPAHLLELIVRRIALFWEPYEMSDSGMVDYEQTGLQVSPTLNALALNEGINTQVMMTLAVIGLGLAWLNHRNRGAALLLGGGMGLYIASLALFYVIGRVRIPSLSFVLPLAAV